MAPYPAQQLDASIGLPAFPYFRCRTGPDQFGLLGLGRTCLTGKLGRVLAQGKDNLDAWWIGLSAVATLTVMLLLLVMIGEGLRQAFDVRARS